MGCSSRIDVIDAVRNALPDTPVVMMTTYTSAEIVETAMKKMAYDYISNYLKIKDIQQVIKNALEKLKFAAKTGF
jgi:DNA-binding NtrC family response regulator